MSLMRKPFPTQQTVNFAAVSFAIQYYKYEEPLALAFKTDASAVPQRQIAKHQIIRSWLTHFSVARSFTGFGKLSDEDRESGYKKIHDLMSLCGERGPGESSVERVLRFRNTLCEELKIKTSLLSATTKLLWLVDRDSIIYDAILRRNLGAKDGDYESYCEKWESQFQLVRSAVEVSVSLLVQSCQLFPAHWNLQLDSREPWFLKRVFDTLHWQDP